MTNHASIKALEAAQRRQQRDAQKRARELERRAKEHAKLSAIEQARLEVETFENHLEVLLSVHKEQGRIWDWTAIAASLPAPSPQKRSIHESKARQSAAVMPIEQKQESQALIERGRLQDEQEFENAKKTYFEERTQFDKLKDMAGRIRAGEYRAYTEALVELNPFAEMSDLGSEINFTVHTAKLAECVLKVKGKQAIPAEVKTLTSSGKVAVKAMPKGRFHEIYQDYLYGCVLRVAREIFALLPLNGLLVTAAADTLDTRTGQMVEQKVLSVYLTRVAFAHIDFNQIHPSETIGSFQHRGDFTASRKTEAFQAIVPLTPADIRQISFEAMGFCDLLPRVQEMHEKLKSKVTELSLSVEATILQTSSSL